MNPRNLTRLGLAAVTCGLILLLNSCSDCKCSLAPGAGATAPTGMTYLAQQEVTGPNVFFRPVDFITTSSLPVIAPTSPMFGGAAFAFSSGGASRVFSGATVGNPNGTSGNGTAVVYMGPKPQMCPTLNCRDILNYRGAGGPNGDFSFDYFLRYRGHKGPDPSNDYNSLQMKFSATGATEYDLSGYQGFVLWARGTGNFSVNLVSRKPGDFIVPAVPAGGFPYSGWNFYLRRFGSELNGNDDWKQVIVYFKDMIQEYGLAADLNTVIKRATGLQFDQQVPVSADFQLDLDYIYFF